MSNEEAIKFLYFSKDHWEEASPVAEAHELAIKALEKEIPKEPSEEVVHCKDCKHLIDKEDTMLRWCDRLICGTVSDDFFCADGEKADLEVEE